MRELRIRVEAVKRERIDYERLLKALIEFARARQKQQEAEAADGNQELRE